MINLDKDSIFKVLYYLFGFIIICSVIIGFMYIYKYTHYIDVRYTYSEYQQNTKIVHGKVLDTKRDNTLLKPTKYQLVVKTSNKQSQLMKVNEKQFNQYQKGSNVKFRIDKDNKVIIDLNKEKDINDKNTYNKNKIQHLNLFN